MEFIAIIVLSLLHFSPGNSVTANNNISQEDLSTRCLREEINLTQVYFSFGFMNSFYNFVQKICHHMQSTMNDCYQKKLVGIILSSNNYFHAENIYHLLLQQPWSMIMLILNMLYIILLPICGILFFCDSCVCVTADSLSSSEILEITEENKISKYLFALSLIMMIITVTVILILMIAYLESVRHTVTGSNGISQSMSSIYTDINLLTNATSTDVTCKLNKTLQKLCIGINNTIQELPNRIIQTLKQDYPITSLSVVIERFEIKNVIDFIDNIILTITSTKILASNLPKTLYQQSSMQNIIDTLQRIENRVTALLQQYNDTLKATNNTRNNVEFYLDNIIETVVYFYANFNFIFKFKK
ncbi:hypothetical protein LOAG_06985 [Loa loa]|uniref:Uncharacterized protein n=1 Tax=Loa loa TaxID=7209 RepID=A0A1S0TYG4_LOALO|nr:hypothetical protein LOAG_06985 [Loa loa]EFO21504.1 hypothetical protein LOAG_06985 [Loa loa]